MTDFIDMLPAREAALDLPPEALGALLMEFFHALDFHQRKKVMRVSYIVGYHMVPEGPGRYDVAKAIIEGWSWLAKEGLVVPRPDFEYTDQYDFSRHGQSLKTRLDVETYRKRAGFPKYLLHPTISDKAWPLYLRGKYDTAVFQAFKEVEVTVRSAGGLGDSDYGVPLMQAAFRPAKHGSPGPLTDASELPGEQESLMFLFAGAYGRFRNPTAHRHGVLNDPTEAFEMLVVASHLLRTVERRSPPSSP